MKISRRRRHTRVTRELAQRFVARALKIGKPLLVFKEFGRSRPVPPPSGKTLVFRRYASRMPQGSLLELSELDRSVTLFEDTTVTIEQYLSTPRPAA